MDLREVLTSVGMRESYVGGWGGARGREGALLQEVKEQVAQCCPANQEPSIYNDWILKTVL